MKLKVSHSIFSIAFSLLVPVLAVAQDPAPLPGTPQDVPIDGGLSLALAAGAGYLVKRRHDARKKKKELLP